MIPSRPSLPSTISRTLGPVDVLGTGRVTSMPAGVATRTARVRSATSPYRSDCMPDERVATHPPSVEWVKLSGKWPRVQPRPFSCSSRCGPSTPLCTRARRESSSIASTRLSLPRSTEMIVRDSPGGASRLPEMFVPPPNGIRTASASMPARSTAATACSSSGRTTASGIRPMSPLRWRTRSRRLLPRAWTTRSWGSVETPSVPAARSSADRSSSRERRLGNAELVEGDRTGAGPFDVDLEVALDERAESRLASMRERHALVSPAPPLHPW